jgi:hypothetical protein
VQSAIQIGQVLRVDGTVRSVIEHWPSYGVTLPGIATTNGSILFSAQMLKWKVENDEDRIFLGGTDRSGATIQELFDLLTHFATINR